MPPTKLPSKTIGWAKFPLPAKPSSTPSPITTISHLSHHLASYLPHRRRSGDISFIYHSNKIPRTNNPARVPPPGLLPGPTTPISRIIFSTARTKGLYTALAEYGERQQQPLLVFLQNPFEINQKYVPSGVHVFGNHNSLDEFPTFGYNTALAARLGLDTETCLPLKKIKDVATTEGVKKKFTHDSRFPVGLYGRLKTDTHPDDLRETIRREFGFINQQYGFPPSPEGGNDHEHPIRVIVFLPEKMFRRPNQVDRLLEPVVTAGWISGLHEAKYVCFLTDEKSRNDLGYQAPRERGVRVVRIDYPRSVAWGLRYMAEQTRLRFPTLDVVEVVKKPVTDREAREEKKKENIMASKLLTPEEMAQEKKRKEKELAEKIEKMKKQSDDELVEAERLIQTGSIRLGRETMMSAEVLKIHLQSLQKRKSGYSLKDKMRDLRLVSRRNASLEPEHMTTDQRRKVARKIGMERAKELERKMKAAKEGKEVEEVDEVKETKEAKTEDSRMVTWRPSMMRSNRFDAVKLVPIRPKKAKASSRNERDEGDEEDE